MGYPETSARLAKAAITHARSRNNPHSLAWALCSAGNTYWNQREPGNAARLATEALELSREHRLLHRHAEAAWDHDQHRRQGPLHGQHFRRAAVAQPEIRGSLPQCLWSVGEAKAGMAPGSTSTTRSASTRAWAIARRAKHTKQNAGGYGDDRRRRPAALPPLPEQARKAGKCSPSPTSPQAPPPTMNLILMK